MARNLNTLGGHPIDVRSSVKSGGTINTIGNDLVNPGLITKKLNLGQGSVLTGPGIDMFGYSMQLNKQQRNMKSAIIRNPAQGAGPQND